VQEYIVQIADADTDDISVTLRKVNIDPKGYVLDTYKGGSVYSLIKKACNRIKTDQERSCSA
jgi:hypothetical protein